MLRAISRRGGVRKIISHQHMISTLAGPDIASRRTVRSGGKQSAAHWTLPDLSADLSITVTSTLQIVSALRPLLGNECDEEQAQIREDPSCNFS